MKRIAKLAAWHWAMARKPFLALCAVFAAQQLALLLAGAALQQNIGHSCATLYAACWQTPAFLAGLAAALLVASAGLWRPGAARTGTALLTLPGPRWHLVAAQSALCALLALAFTAWQVVLYAAYYAPVTAVLTATAGSQLAAPAATVYCAQMTVTAAVQPAVPATTLYAQAALLPLFQVLAPAFPLGWAVLAAGFVCVVVQSGCLFFHRGWGRAVSAALWLFTCGAALLAVYAAWGLHKYAIYAAALFAALAVLVAALAVQLLWTLLRLRRGSLL